MNHVTRTAAGLGTALALAVPTALVVAAPAHADTERRGACGAGTYELSVDREDGGYEVSVDIDRVAADSRWRVVMKHDGQRFYRNVLRADREGELDVDRQRANTSGRDTFTFRAKRLGQPVSCSARVSVR
jgi:hypothetical protein